MSNKSHPTGGVRPMNIAGRLVMERERLVGMTDAERAWRAQWLKDQILAPNEPRHIKEMYHAMNNPIRRFYRYPLDKLQETLEPKLGLNQAAHIRYFAGKIVMGYMLAVGIAYYFKYAKNDWMRKSGWLVLESRESIHEGDPEYPMVSDKFQGSDYNDRGFSKLKLNL